MSHSYKNKQAGFSLVELMIGMVVGLVLLGGILEILLGNRESFQAQQSQAALQENARLTSFLVTNSLAMAAFHVSGLVEEEDVPGLSPAIVPFEGGNSDEPDRIRIRLQARWQDNIQNCLGGQIGDEMNPEQAVISDFEYSVDLANNQLECNVDPDNPATAPQPLIENVENLQIEYGLDTNNSGSADRYLQAQAGAGGFNQREVVSLRLQILLATPDDVLVQRTQQSYTLLDPDGGNVTFNDRLQRQVVDRVIALRNRLN